jgi:23S rRNA pseudouridine1911/1915/1917 synthase
MVVHAPAARATTMRLDKLLVKRFGLSRRQAREAVWRGCVDVAGRICLEPGVEVQPDAPIAYAPGRPRRENPRRRLRVLYEDRHIMVVDKPAGLLTQPTPARESDTLLELAGRYLARTRGLARPYVGIVHRLDRDTSGVILLACSPRAVRPLQAKFRAHALDRVYIAICEGIPQASKGTIDFPIVPDRGDGRRGAARAGAGGTNAVTHYEMIENWGETAASIACRLETGRTHQIRIHLAAIGHPVVGDPVYRPKNWPPFPIPFLGQALHAVVLGLDHPITGEPLRIEAPLPPDITELIAQLRRAHGSSAAPPAGAINRDRPV